MTETKPEGLETKDTGGEHVRIAGAMGEERLVGYSPAAVPNRDGMADGLTPGVTNTPGPYEAPADQGSSTPKSGSTASKRASSSKSATGS